MSGYQSYEFQAIDRPLTPEEQKYIHSLSSRVKVTATNAQFVYNYGDFRGEPEALVDRCFDLYVHVSSYGVRQLIIRLPKGLVDPEIFVPYIAKRLVDVKKTKRSILLNINIYQEGYATWLEERTYAASLLPLREELLRGDLRLLYLAWLAAGFAEEAIAPMEELVEPPVPANLKKLSPALQALADLFGLDRDLIAAAAMESPGTQVQEEPIAEWIAALPEADRNAYLVRVAQGETHVGAELMQRLRQKGTTSKAKLKSPGRTLAQLCSIADEKYEIRETKANKSAAKARQKYLKSLEPKVTEIWQEVIDLIELKQSQPYTEAVAHLVDLRDLAHSQDKLAEFQARIVGLKQQFSTRSALITRLKNAKLLT
jgi:hypothetical protein